MKHFETKSKMTSCAFYLDRDKFVVLTRDKHTNAYLLEYYRYSEKQMIDSVRIFSAGVEGVDFVFDTCS